MSTVTNHELNHFHPPAAGSLRQRTVLITGAAGALGSTIARAAATLGSDLVLVDKNERALNQLYDEISETTDIEPGLYPLDLAGATVDDYNTMASTIGTEFGGLHGLIHCAAELGQLTPLANADAAQWQKTFSTNVHGPVFLTSRLIPLMRASAPASIVFTIDSVNKAYWSCYAATKAAITATMQSLSDELDADRDSAGNLKVTCNVVLPQKMRSTLRTSAFPGEDPNGIPDAKQNAAAYLFLLGDDARAINGQTIDLRNPPPR